MTHRPIGFLNRRVSAGFLRIWTAVYKCTSGCRFVLADASTIRTSNGTLPSALDRSWKRQQSMVRTNAADQRLLTRDHPENRQIDARGQQDNTNAQIARASLRSAPTQQAPSGHWPACHARHGSESIMAQCWGGTRTQRNPRIGPQSVAASPPSRCAERRFLGEPTTRPPRRTRLPSPVAVSGSTKLPDS